MSRFRTYILTFLHGVCFSLAHAGNDGNRRLVLVEEFTNTGCAPCAEFAPYLDAVLRERMDDVVAIKYHYNFPSPNDPYYLNEPEDIDIRGNFYGITGVPSVFYDGKRGQSHPNGINPYIDQALEVKESVDIDVDAVLSNHHLSVKVAVSPLRGIQSDNLRAFVAVVEEWKVFDKAFPNGEKDFYYVVQKILPGGSGYQLGEELTTGQTCRFGTEWDVNHFYDETQLGIVTFVQDMATHEVLGTVYTPYPTGHDDAAKVLDVFGTPDYICSPSFSSDIVIRCTGKNGLHSADINVSINGHVQTTPWTGSLDYLQRDTVNTPEFTGFSFAESGNLNDVEIWLSAINGTQQESPKWKATLHNAVKAKNAARLSIMTDRKPEETTWKLFNSAGDEIHHGGPYSEPRKKVVEILPLSKDDCYTIEFYDSGSDGINGTNGAGYYKLDQITSDGKSKMLLQATYEESMHQVNFSLTEADATLSVDNLSLSSDTPVTVYDTNGMKICRTKAGNIRQSLASLNLKNGIYIISTMKGDKITSHKISVY